MEGTDGRNFSAIFTPKFPHVQMFPHKRADRNLACKVGICLFLNELIHNFVSDRNVEVNIGVTAVSFQVLGLAWLRFKVEQPPVLHVSVMDLLGDRISSTNQFSNEEIMILIPIAGNLQQLRTRIFNLILSIYLSLCLTNQCQ